MFLRQDSGGRTFQHTNQVTVKGGSRWTTLQGYLRPALGRRNLHVVVSAHVQKERRPLIEGLVLYNLVINMLSCDRIIRAYF